MGNPVFSDPQYTREAAARLAIVRALLNEGYMASEKSAQDTIAEYGIAKVDAWKMDRFSKDSLEILDIIVTVEESLEIDLDEGVLADKVTPEASLGALVKVVAEAMEKKGLTGSHYLGF